jgi:hypothetical protein
MVTDKRDGDGFRPSVKKALDDFGSTWEPNPDEFEHLAELLNDTYNAGAAEYCARAEQAERDWYDAKAEFGAAHAAIAAEARRAAISECLAVATDRRDFYGDEAEGRGGQEFTDAIAAEAALNELVRRLELLASGAGK